eukprot:TRINITY_DN653_c0_g1_i4.p1 TRINITY_DN653_c0_g1~~TRINITY_DN653_c0_g1_i4.p1  ORF type:complete len:1070 (+),score=197.82 TRINITY_DN653_c0_g1_i4:75-3212(+)
MGESTQRHVFFVFQALFLPLLLVTLHGVNAFTCDPVCAHGDCVETNTCSCWYGWDGETCDHEIEFHWGPFEKENVGSATPSEVKILNGNDGAIFVVYSDAMNNNLLTLLMYNGSHWSNHPLSGFGNVVQISAAVYSSGNLGIVYKDSSNSDLVFREFMVDTMEWESYVTYLIPSSPGSTSNSLIFDGKMAKGEYPSIATVPGATRDAYCGFRDSNNNNQLMVYTMSTYSFDYLANNLPTSAVSHVAVSVSTSGVVYAGFSDAGQGGKLSVIQWGGSSWSTVGGSFGISSGSVSFVNILVSSDNTILFVGMSDSSVSNGLSVMEWDDGSWSSLGGSTLVSSGNPVEDISITENADGVLFVGFKETSNSVSSLIVKTWNGHAWSGDDTSLINSVDSPSLSLGADDILYAGYVDQTASKLSISTEYYCQPSCIHGNCTGMNICTCENNWGGSLCDVPICSPSCAHGSCNTSFECECYNGWSGDACNKEEYGWKYLGGKSTIADTADTLFSVVDSNGLCHILFDGSLIGTATIGMVSIDFANGDKWSTEDLSSEETFVGHLTGFIIGPGGSMYSIYRSDSITLSHMQLNMFSDDNGWNEIGSTLSSSLSTSATLAGSEGGILVVHRSSDYNEMAASIFSEGTWTTLSGTFELIYNNYASFVTPRGDIYVVYEHQISDSFSARLLKHTGSDWSVSGEDHFSDGRVSDLSIVCDDDERFIYVAYTDGAHENKMTVKRLEIETGAWTTIGTSGFTIGKVALPKLVIGDNQNLFVAFQDGSVDNSASVMTFESNKWKYVGEPGFTNATVSSLSFQSGPNSTYYLAYIHDDKPSAMVIQLCLSECVHGICLSNDTCLCAPGWGGMRCNLSVCVHGEYTQNNECVCEDGWGGKTCEKMTCDPACPISEWRHVGNTHLTYRSAQHISLAFNHLDGMLYLGYADDSLWERASVLSYDTLNPEGWDVVGEEGFSNRSISNAHVGVGLNGTLVMGFQDNSRGMRGTAMQYVGDQWQFLGTPGFSSEKYIYTARFVVSEGGIVYVCQDGEYGFSFYLHTG